MATVADKKWDLNKGIEVETHCGTQLSYFTSESNLYYDVSKLSKEQSRPSMCLRGWSISFHVRLS
jgi:hypothetical protein